MKQKLFSHLSAAIHDAIHRPFEVCGATAVGGGSINEAFRLEGTNGECYFLKLNDARHHSMLSSRGDARRLGQQLAALHRCKSPRFGFPQDNFIGTTQQPNAWNDSWIDFWREQRLGFQLRLAADNGYGSQLQSLGDKLLDALPAFFEGYTPQPSLLHGDLWSGNHAYTADGAPTIFDPASYYGDCECDLAMSELFGGFPASFYTAYRAEWPLHEGYETRRDLYNLYHVLNHANLFGGGYVLQTRDIMQRLLSQTG